MYETFYGLKDRPFQLSPDPEFFYASKTHSKGLAYLHYGIKQGEGFVVVTGIPGTGKTTLLNTLISELPKDKFLVAKLSNTLLTTIDLLRAISRLFGLNSSSQSKVELLEELEGHLLQQARMGKHVLLMIDEAHNLSIELLEELRLLSNFQFHDNYYLQIFLLGQQQLEDTLNLPELMQLRQRVLVSHHLEPIPRIEIGDYVEHRLVTSGWKGTPEFSHKALLLIHHYSDGIPRQINTLSDRIMLRAYMEEQEAISEETIECVIEELRLEPASYVHGRSFGEIDLSEDIPVSRRQVELDFDHNTSAEQTSATADALNKAFDGTDAIASHASNNVVAWPPGNKKTEPGAAVASATQASVHTLHRSDSLAEDLGQVYVEDLVESLDPIVTDNAEMETLNQNSSLLGRERETSSDEQNSRFALYYDLAHQLISQAAVVFNSHRKMVYGVASFLVLSILLISLLGNEDENLPAPPPIAKETQSTSNQADLINGKTPIFGFDMTPETASQSDEIVEAEEFKQEAFDVTGPQEKLVDSFEAALPQDASVDEIVETQTTDQQIKQIPPEDLAVIENVPTQKEPIAKTVIEKGEQHKLDQTKDKKIELAVTGDKNQTLKAKNVAVEGKPSGIEKPPVKVKTTPKAKSKPKQQVVKVTKPAPAKIVDQISTAERHEAKAITEAPVIPVADVVEEVSIGQADLNRLLNRFRATYKKGDASRFISLFSENISSNDVDNSNDLLKEYQHLFDVTDARSIEFSEMKWDRKQNVAKGEGEFRVSVQEKGSSRSTMYSGKIELEVERNDKDVLFTKVFYTYSN